MSGNRVADEFFAGDASVIKTYEIEHEKLAVFNKEVAFAMVVAGVILPPLMLIFGAEYYLCKKREAEELAFSEHLAITADGVLRGSDEHFNVNNCMPTPKTSSLIPFDKITSIDVQEPGSAIVASGTPCLYSPKNTIYTVIIEDSGGSLRRRSATVIRGIKDAEQFKADVLAAKSGQKAAVAVLPPRPAVAGAPINEAIDRDAAGEKKSVTDELAGLATMFKEGLLTKSEFDSAKAKLLNNGASFSAHV